jgi:hypothetical protein
MSVLSAAQQPKAVQQDKWEVFGGYSYSRAYGYPGAENFDAYGLQGGQASITYFPLKHFGLTADFAGFNNNSSFEESTINTKSQDYLFGPTVRFGLKNAKYQRIQFFAHQLIGVSHVSFSINDGGGCGEDESSSCSTNPVTSVSGGGFDFKVGKHLSIRPMEMDYWSQQLSVKSLEKDTDPSDSGVKFGVNGFRYSAGAVLRF